jgi:hypothetical protein
MGCCLFASLLAGAPRLGFLIWWVAQPYRIQATFQSFIWPALGLVFLPWTTIVYVAVAPGGITWFDWILLAVALLADISSYGGGGWAQRRRMTAPVTIES